MITHDPHCSISTHFWRWMRSRIASNPIRTPLAGSIHKIRERGGIISDGLSRANTEPTGGVPWPGSGKALRTISSWYRPGAWRLIADAGNARIMGVINMKSWNDWLGWLEGGGTRMHLACSVHPVSLNEAVALYQKGQGILVLSTYRKDVLKASFITECL